MGKPAAHEIISEAAAPHGTLVTFPDAGHLVLDESPEASVAVARFCGTDD